jgi:starvation-inducible DNA-binding protein
MKSHHGIDAKSCKKIAQELSRVLGNTYVLYVKTQNFHWNIIDPRFYSLHKMLEGHYEELAEAIDEIAERIRMLEQHSPGSMKEFLKTSTLKEFEGNLSGDQMLLELLKDHENCANELRTLVPAIQKLTDEGTADMLIDRLRFHEKTAWMLRSHFKK